MKRTSKCIIAALISTTISANLLAQVRNYTEESPFGGIYSVACSEESVAVSGTLITDIHLMFNGNIGNVQFHTKEGPDTNGIGMTSQSPYKVKIDEFAKFRFDRDTLSDQGLKQKFTLQGQSNFTINYILRARFDTETQSFKTTFEKLDITCK